MKIILPQVTYHAFCDESTYNTGRFHALAVVSLLEKNVPAVKEKLQNILADSSVHEFSWTDLNGARMRFCAEKIVDYVVKRALLGDIRVDILIIDSSDSRHNVKGREDIRNIERMYYHLFIDIIRNRWPLRSNWRIFPDEQGAINWEKLKEVLINSGLETSPENLKGESFKQNEIPFSDFRISKILVCHSSEEVLVQVADLFSGMAVYSRNNFDKYLEWETKEQVSSDSQLRLSKSDKEKCHVIHLFYETCKENKLGVSLKTHKGLLTPKPANPFNYWLYKPQTEKDKAPIKNKQN